ncbi:MAG: glycoside hydrolase family 35 protein [Cellulomonadaceae bacterium]
MRRFEVGPESFLVDGEPVQIVSGALHYFRIHPDQWLDRIRRAKSLGLNTIETYVAWNFHAPTPDTFDLTGARDLGRFLRLVEAEGLFAIVRPGPYICAEWDNGGLPAWLFLDPDVGVRRSEPKYLAAVQSYFDAILPVVAPLQIDAGGPVVLVQVENEYGAFGDDTEYLRTLERMLRDGGVTVPLVTCDQASDEMLVRGGLPGVLRTATFGSRSPERLEVLRRHQPTGPLMCMEYWNGWFDAWGQDHHVTDPEGSSADLAALLAAGASVNLYMAHGGTNFGFTNGANDKGVYRPTVTSYDYDAPLAEDATATAKSRAFARVITRHRGIETDAAPERVPAPVPRPPATARVRSLWSLVETAQGWTEHEQPPTHDELGAFSGFVLYRSRLTLSGTSVLSLAEVRDRAQVFLDGRPAGVFDRAENARALTVVGDGELVLDLLVEDQGRVNYGPRIGEPKGVLGPVLLDGAPLTGWRCLPLPLDRWARDLSVPGAVPGAAAGTQTRAADLPLAGPALVSWDVETSAGSDLFLRTDRWGKGNAWVNGWNLGRYWTAGPQETLYVPGPLTRAGSSAVVAFELLGAADGVLRFADAPRWRAVTD